MNSIKIHLHVSAENIDLRDLFNKSYLPVNIQQLFRLYVISTCEPDTADNQKGARVKTAAEPFLEPHSFCINKRIKGENWNEVLIFPAYLPGVTHSCWINPAL